MKSNKNTTTRKTINEMTSLIVDRFKPVKVILFGSYARGCEGIDSDVDLLVVMPVKGSKRKIRLDIRQTLHDIHVPKDIVVSTPEEFEWRKEIVGTIERPAALEGEVLYART